MYTCFNFLLHKVSVSTIWIGIVYSPWRGTINTTIFYDMRRINMKLAILEDRPWIMKKMIEKLKKDYNGLDEIKIIYYESSNMYNEEIIQTYKNEKIEVCKVNKSNFEDELNELYGDKDRIFFFDLVLNDDASYFEDRINVIYAEKKKGDKRIWFYTTSGTFAVTKIEKMFSEQCIPVIDYDLNENALLLDENAVDKIFRERGIQKRGR